MLAGILWSPMVQAAVVISEIYTETPSGQSAYDEFVELCNTGGDAVDVAGWSLTDGDHLDSLVPWSEHSSSLADGWSGYLVLDSSIIPAGACAVVLDPDYLGGTQPHAIEHGTVLFTVEDSAIGEGLGPNDPITLYSSTGTANSDVESTYGTPVSADAPEDRDDDGLDAIPLQAVTGRSVYRAHLHDLDAEGSWLTAAPSPGYRRFVGLFEVSSDGSTDYPTLSAALRVAGAGSDVLIHEGLYFDDVEITESVTITGSEEDDGAVLDGDITIVADNGPVSISLVTFTGSVEVENATAYLESNLFLDASSTWRYSSGGIENNIINGSTTGIDLQYYSSPDVRGNQFVDTVETSLSCFFGSEPEITENEFRSSQGVAIDCTAGPLIENNIIEGFDSGVILRNSTAQVVNNEITDAVGVAVDISHSPDAWVVLNILKEFGTGVLSSQSATVVSGNLIFEGNGDGVVVDGGWVPDFFGTIEKDSTVLGNTLVQNEGSGIVLGGVTLSGDIAEPVVWNNVVYGNEGAGIRSVDAAAQTQANLSFGNTGGNWVGLSSGTSDLEEDPVFTNLEQSDFLPGVNSPLVDAGVTSELVTEFDLRGASRLSDGDGDGVVQVDIGAYEACVDLDRDGYFPSSCLSEETVDCDDEDAGVNPSAEEIWYDGVDQNCDGNDNDQDGDGVSVDSDCDDQDPYVQTGCLEDTGFDGDGATPKPGGCGCTTGTPAGGSLWMLLLAGGLVRRRRAA